MLTKAIKIKRITGQGSLATVTLATVTLSIYNKREVDWTPVTKINNC